MVIMVFTLPMSFGAKPNQESFIKGDVLKDQNILVTLEFIKPNKIERLEVTMLKPKTEGMEE